MNNFKLLEAVLSDESNNIYGFQFLIKNPTRNEWLNLWNKFQEYHETKAPGLKQKYFRWMYNCENKEFYIWYSGELHHTTVYREYILGLDDDDYKKVKPIKNRRGIILSYYNPNEIILEYETIKNGLRSMSYVPKSKYDKEVKQYCEQKLKLKLLSKKEFDEFHRNN